MTCLEDPIPVVMTFSGHDPTGGAGIQADIESLMSVGCHCVPVCTTITAQDSSDVKDLIPVESILLIEQARAVLEDMPIAAFKLGLMGSIENIEAVHTILMDYPHVPVVLDPIVFAGGGSPLSTDYMNNALSNLILPLTTVVTPNTSEVHYLAPESDSLEASAQEILETGCDYVLVTGTHAITTDVVNKLYNKQGLVKTFKWPRLANIYHGSGCTLAASLAGYLAHRVSMVDATEQAQAFTWKSLKAGRRLGMGQLIPNRAFWSLDQSDSKVQTR